MQGLGFQLEKKIVSLEVHQALLGAPSLNLILVYLVVHQSPIQRTDDGYKNIKESKFL